MAQALSFLETSMAAVGHFREQIPQNMQALMSMSICPLVLSQYSRFTRIHAGGGFLKKPFENIFSELHCSHIITFLLSSRYQQKGGDPVGSSN
jgi:hypothetical protein